MKHGIFQEDNKFKVYVNDQQVYSARMLEHAEYQFRKANKRIGASGSEQITISQSVFTEQVKEKVSKFHINERFDFLAKTVKMVANGIQPSAVISGSGGLGKTHTVRKTLVECGLKDLSGFIAESDEGTIVNRHRGFIFVKGYSTAKGLFRTLFENNDSVIIFDDCDSVLKDPVALNLLKGALDSYDTRIITWNAEIRDPDLPRSFIFTGRVIFISNMTEDKIDQAIRSRSAVIDVTMTLQEIVDRMQVMINDPEFLPDFEQETKTDALNFINELKSEMREVNLRTLITVCKVRAADTDGTWKNLAEYLTCK
jgi:hypothetical protein